VDDLAEAKKKAEALVGDHATAVGMLARSGALFTELQANCLEPHTAMDRLSANVNTARLGDRDRCL
jgi:hypothetical protein